MLWVPKVKKALFVFIFCPSEKTVDVRSVKMDVRKIINVNIKYFGHDRCDEWRIDLLIPPAAEDLCPIKSRVGGICSYGQR